MVDRNRVFVPVHCGGRDEVLDSVGTGSLGSRVSFINSSLLCYLSKQPNKAGVTN